MVDEFGEWGGRFDVLDEALCRPGRFDRVIRVNRPDKTGQSTIRCAFARCFEPMRVLSQGHDGTGVLPRRVLVRMSVRVLN